MIGTIGLGASTPWNWMPPPLALDDVEAVEHAHEIDSATTRGGYSPSVTAFSPTPSCILTTSMIALSSIAFSSAADMVPSSKCALRARLTASGPEEAADDVGAEGRGGHGGLLDDIWSA